jgi:hypothetical protein
LRTPNCAAPTLNSANRKGVQAIGAAPPQPDDVRTLANKTREKRQGVFLPERVHISAAPRDVGLSGTQANVERVLSLRTDADRVRRQRYLNRANSRIVTPIKTLPVPSGRPAVLAPGQPVERLTALRELTIEKYAQEMFRCGAPGGSSFTVKFATSTNEVDYRVPTVSRKLLH